MNRPIKFRASYMPEWGEVGIFPVSSIDWNENLIDGEIPIHLVNLMQFTGLTDKNGKEIYEGDVLGTPNTGMGSFPFYKTGWVIFENGAFTLHAFGDDQKDERFEFRKALEVIGNIYENPDLLGV